MIFEFFFGWLAGEHDDQVNDLDDEEDGLLEDLV